MIVHPRWLITFTVQRTVMLEAPSEAEAIARARDREILPEFFRIDRRSGQTFDDDGATVAAAPCPEQPADEIALAFLAHAAAGEGCGDSCPGYFRNVDTDLIERCDDCAHEIGVADEVDDEMVRSAVLAMTNDRGVLRFRCADDARLYTLADMIAANPGDGELAEWMRGATAGDTWGLDVTAVRLAS